MATQYYIREGVRRAVAAREAGKTDIPARVIASGVSDFFTRLLLDCLHSPKTVIVRDQRYIRYTEYPTAVLQTEPPPIDVELLGSPGQGASVPLSQVTLT